MDSDALAEAMSARQSPAEFMPEPPGQLLEAHALVGKPLATALLRELAHQQVPVALRRRCDPQAHGFGRIVECRDDAIALDLEETAAGVPTTDGDDDYVAVAFLDGVKVQFDARLSGDNANAGHRVLRGAPPVAVYRLQRREAYRVPIIATEGRCVLRHPPDDEFSVEIIDLSARGLSIAWPTLASPAIGTVWEHARIEFAGRPPLPCTLVACRIDAGDDGPGRVGCEFGPLPPEVERAVQVLVNDLQRTARPGS